MCVCRGEETCTWSYHRGQIRAKVLNNIVVVIADGVSLSPSILQATTRGQNAGSLLGPKSDPAAVWQSNLAALQRGDRQPVPKSVRLSSGVMTVGHPGLLATWDGVPQTLCCLATIARGGLQVKRYYIFQVGPATKSYSGFSAVKGRPGVCVTLSLSLALPWPPMVFFIQTPEPSVLRVQLPSSINLKSCRACPIKFPVCNLMPTLD